MIRSIAGVTMDGPILAGPEDLSKMMTADENTGREPFGLSV